MSKNMERENDYDKKQLIVPALLQDAFAELAEICGDILEANNPGADFAGVEEKAVEAVHEFGRKFVGEAAEGREGKS